VSETAKAIGLSQSAVSAALAKLRQTFGDELLYMDGRGLSLTDKARALIEPTERSCLGLETLFRPATFDPMGSQRRFVVATADYVTLLLAPLLASLFAEQAPDVSTHFIDVSDDSIADLSHGSIDAIIVPPDTIDEGVKNGLLQEFLFSDDVVVIARRGRSIQRPMTRQFFHDSRRAVFQMSHKKELYHQRLEILNDGFNPDNTIIVQQFMALPAIVEVTDCLAVVQRRIAQRFAQMFDIDIYEAPCEQVSLQLCLFWGKPLARDPAQIWFRERLKIASSRLTCVGRHPLAHEAASSGAPLKPSLPGGV
jgi:DNA-binding transcriptional LysR family regulator